MTVGVLTALPKEHAAVGSMLENVRRHVSQGGRVYDIGEAPALAGGAHVVATVLADQGTAATATYATQMIEDFPNAQALVFVGIAGGVPWPSSAEKHVRLGDVVVPGEQGVVTYDFVKEHEHRIEPRHPPRPPDSRFLAAARRLAAAALAGDQSWLNFLTRATHLPQSARPPADTDILRATEDQSVVVAHPPEDGVVRSAGLPRVFIGTIGCANRVQKNARHRDQLRDQFDIRAIEMEAFGIAEAGWLGRVGYFVVRGVCDYCDSSKNDIWQGYAAAIAAAYARALLGELPVLQARATSRGAAEEGSLPAELLQAIEKLKTSDFRAGLAVLESGAKGTLHKFDSQARYLLLSSLGHGYALVTDLNRSATAYWEAAEALDDCPETWRARILALAAEKRDEECLSEARAAADKWKGDAHLLALRLVQEPETESLNSLEKLVPLKLQENARVLGALCGAAVRRGMFAEAATFASRAIARGLQRPHFFLALGDALVVPFKFEGVGPHPSVTLQEDRDQLRKAVAHYDEGIRSALGFPCEVGSVCDLYLHKADALSCLGEVNAAGQCLRDVQKVAPDVPEAKRAFAIWLASTDALAPASMILREVVEATDSMHARTELAALLGQIGGTAALLEAVEQADMVLTTQRDTAVWLRASALRTAVQAHQKLGNTELARELVRQFGDNFGVSGHLAAAWLSGELEDKDAELRSVRAAAEAATTETPGPELRDLVYRLLSHKQYSTALRVGGLMRVYDRTEHDDLAQLHAACSAGETRVALELFDTFRKKHGTNADALHMELEIIERDDPERAVSLIDSHLAVSPDDSLVRLRKSFLGVMFGRNEWLEKDYTKFPDPRTCGARNGRVAVRVLCEAQEFHAALDYAFALFRANFEADDAREALFAVLFGCRSKIVLREFAQADIDCAVTIVDGNGAESTAILESGQDPQRSRGEYATNSEFARMLLGKRVGDDIMLASSDLPGRITKIEDKYWHWRRCLMRPNPAGDAVAGVRSVVLGESQEEQLAAVRRILEQSRAAERNAMTIYRDHPAVSVHFLAEHMSVSPFEATLRILADQNSVLRTPQHKTRLDLARTTLVVDQSAIAALHLADLQEAVVESKVPLLISPHTSANLFRLGREENEDSEHLVLWLDESGEISGERHSSGAPSARQSLLRRISRWSRDNCEVAFTPTSMLSNDDRQKLVEVIGDSGVDSVLVAAEQGRVLLSDDFVQSVLARERGVAVVTTRQLVDALLASRQLSQKQAIHAVARLFGAGYSGCEIRVGDIFPIARDSAWNGFASPLADVMRFFRNRAVPVEMRLRLGLELITVVLRLSNNVFSGNACVDAVLRDTEALGICDDSYADLIGRVRNALSGSLARRFERILATREMGR